METRDANLVTDFRLPALSPHMLPSRICTHSPAKANTPLPAQTGKLLDLFCPHESNVECTHAATCGDRASHDRARNAKGAGVRLNDSCAN
eukprot:3087731-Amphidinium_carterae.1